MASNCSSPTRKREGRSMGEGWDEEIRISRAVIRDPPQARNVVALQLRGPLRKACRVGEAQESLEGWLKIIPTADGDVVAFALQRHEIETALTCHGGDAEADIRFAILDRQGDLGLAAGRRHGAIEVGGVDPMGLQQVEEE